MPIPDYQTIMLPLIQKLEDGKPHALQDIIERLADYFKLSDDERQTLQPSGRQRIFNNRVYWAKKYLSEADLISSPSRGFIELTPSGKKVLKEKPSYIDNRYLEKFESFRNFKGIIPEKIELKGQNENKTPEEIMVDMDVELKRSLSIDIMENIQNSSPQFFERLILDVIVAMGYGGSFNDASKRVGKTGDGGIDGIIKEDKLGLDAIYLQAKRWKNVVGRPEIQSFAGALDGFKAKKGIFITTSTFTPHAYEYVDKIEKKIVLINGEELAALMIEYNVGVAVANSFVVKKIDTDYFNE